MAKYQEQFDMLVNQVDLSTTQVISCFLSGLNEEIQCVVRMFKPSSLNEAYCLAKLQEATLASIARRKSILGKPASAPMSSSSYRGSVENSFPSPVQRYSGRQNTVGTHVGPRSVVSSLGSATFKPRKVLTSKDIDDRRAKGMCFFCEEKYYPGHKCAGQVYSLNWWRNQLGKRK